MRISVQDRRQVSIAVITTLLIVAAMVIPLPVAAALQTRKITIDARGEALNITLPSYLQDRDYLHAHSPSDLFAQLRFDSSFKALSDEQLWDLYAFA